MQMDREGEGSLVHPRIIVVDDDRDSANLMSTMLSAWGWSAESVFDAESLLQRLDSERFDLALVDIGLPGLDGDEAALLLRERLGAAAPVLVALTGRSGPDDRLRSERAGFAAHLVKPVDGEVLHRVLASSLGAPRRSA